MAHILRCPWGMTKQEQITHWLSGLAEDLIARIVADLDAGIEEGVVLCTGPAPYRRLDCDGRALAYIRVRPRKRAVRVDVTGLWKAPTRSRLIIPAAGGAATLLVRSHIDVSDAVRYLVRSVERTRGEDSVREPIAMRG